MQAKILSGAILATLLSGVAGAYTVATTSTGGPSTQLTAGAMTPSMAATTHANGNGGGLKVQTPAGSIDVNGAVPVGELVDAVAQAAANTSASVKPTGAGGTGVTAKLTGPGGSVAGSGAVGGPALAGLPGLDVAGLGELLTRLPASLVPQVTGLLGSFNATELLSLGNVIQSVGLENLPLVSDLLSGLGGNSANASLAASITGVDPAALPLLGSVLSAPGGSAVAGPLGDVLGNLPTGALGNLTGILSLPTSQLGTVSSLLSGLTAGDLNLLTGILNPSGGLLGGLLDTLSGVLNLGGLTSAGQTVADPLLDLLSPSSLDLVGNLLSSLPVSQASAMGGLLGVLGDNGNLLAPVTSLLGGLPTGGLGSVAGLLNNLTSTDVPLVGPVLTTVKGTGLQAVAGLLSTLPVEDLPVAGELLEIINL